MSLLPLLLLPLAFATVLLSALALYAASAHCRWLVLRRWRAMGLPLGLALAVASLALWIAELGAGAGFCAMLGTWMLAMMALPYLAAWTGSDIDIRGAR